MHSTVHITETMEARNKASRLKAELDAKRVTPPALQRYSVAALFLLAAFLIRWALSPLVGDHHYFLLFIPAALAAGWYGRGYTPALMVLIAGYILGDFFFQEPHFAFGPYTPDMLVAILTYALITVIGTGIFESFRRTQERLELSEKYRATLEKEIRERLLAEQELHSVQERLQKYADDLELRVAERTASLEASVKSLEGVLYHVAHDLRAPLRAMNGFTHLLVKTCHPEQNTQARDFAGRILGASETMDQKISALLEFGKLGHQPLEMEPVDLEVLVAGVLKKMQKKILCAKAEIKVDASMPEVMGDPDVLEQALQHLISNALTFVAPGQTPKIHIWANQSGDHVSLFVEDHGIGIEPEYHDKIFGLFQKVHEPGRYPGTGMGLAIAKKAVERMGGHIGLTSAPGTATRFWTELKAA
jgi:signal transduction histidine kinase